ncbi:hypothetical protein [Neisseria sp.]|uniref:hypothetical protein n=1 Tax=Neisseria sp. TaxID=192066 RepID=UPI0035A11EFB
MRHQPVHLPKTIRTLSDGLCVLQVAAFLNAQTELPSTASIFRRLYCGTWR